MGPPGATPADKGKEQFDKSFVYRGMGGILCSLHGFSEKMGAKIGTSPIFIIFGRHHMKVLAGPLNIGHPVS